MELDAQLSSLLTSALRNRDAGAAAAPLSRSAAQSNVARAGELLRQHQRRRATTSLARLTAPSCAAAAEAVIATQVNSGFVEWALQLARNLDAVGRLQQTIIDSDMSPVPRLDHPCIMPFGHQSIQGRAAGTEDLGTMIKRNTIAASG